MKHLRATTSCLLFLGGALAYSSFVTKTPFVKEGAWRAAFTVAGSEVPFNFEVRGTRAEDARVYLLNATERVELDHLVQRNDSLFIPIEIYDAVLEAKIDGNALTGVYRRLHTNQPDPGIPFRAEPGKKYRFTEKNVAPAADLSGKWDLNLHNPAEVNRTVGVFEQKGNYLTGTIMTTTGDYRYLEGTVQGNEFFLSAFSGSGPTLIRGKIGDANRLTGEFVTGRGNIPLDATRNDQAALPDPYALTYLKEGYTTLDFTFPDLAGKPVSLKDPKYVGKVVVVTILGSWCPNCLDEAAFLAPWYQANRDRGVEIIGLAFERKNDPVFAKARLDKLKERFGVEYDLLFAGLADKQAASEALPALSKVLSFPTTIFVDRQGKVSKIHTGFTGPATGRYYEDYVREFNADVDHLLNQKPATGSVGSGR
ncbi:MAG: TlpA family protein disulfide reductase [Ferruginibacter sp.]|nr:TlpA family protein disulfide reductase [Cytophagales bacterium]